jgi:hypothetical protein
MKDQKFVQTESVIIKGVSVVSGEWWGSAG